MPDQHPWYDRDILPVYVTNNAMATPGNTASTVLYVVPANRRCVVHSAVLLVDFAALAGAGDTGRCEFQRRIPAPVVLLAKHENAGDQMGLSTSRNAWGAIFLDEGDQLYVSASAVSSTVNVTALVHFIATEFAKIS